MRDFPAVKIILITILVGFLSASPLFAQAQELPLGDQLPTGDELTRLNGSTTTIGNLTGSAGTAVIFWSNQCTWTQRYEDRVQGLHQNFDGQGINIVLVNSSDATAFPRESLEAMRDQGYNMTYVRDEGGSFARALGAVRTPHVFVFDENNTLVYVGTIDDSPGDPGNVGNRYLRDVLQALTAGQDIPVAQTRAFGCTIRLAN